MVLKEVGSTFWDVQKLETSPRKTFSGLFSEYQGSISQRRRDLEWMTFGQFTERPSPRTKVLGRQSVSGWLRFALLLKWHEKKCALKPNWSSWYRTFTLSPLNWFWNPLITLFCSSNRLKPFETHTRKLRSLAWFRERRSDTSKFTIFSRGSRVKSRQWFWKRSLINRDTNFFV